MVARNLDVLLDILDANEVVSRVGSYWHNKTAKRRGVQIDLIVERDDGVTHVIECKWSRNAVGRAVLAELEDKCRLYPNPKQHTLEPAIVAAAGAVKSVIDTGTPVISLADLLRR